MPRTLERAAKLYKSIMGVDPMAWTPDTMYMRIDELYKWAESSELKLFKTREGLFEKEQENRDRAMQSLRRAKRNMRRLLDNCVTQA